METELRVVLQILSLLYSWRCIWMVTLQTLGQFLVLNVCVCRYSRVCNAFLTSRTYTFKSVSSRYFISEGRASRNSVSGLFLSTTALTSLQVHPTTWYMSLFLLACYSNCFSLFLSNIVFVVFKSKLAFL
jgi:hypothetical protein